MASEAQQTGRVLKRAQYRNQRSMERALAQVGTTLAQWDALRAIDEAPNSSAHDLAVATFQSDQAFGTLANRLERHELIARAPGHGRRVEHLITKKGKQTLVAGEALNAEVAASSLAALNAEEVATLHKLLLRVGEEIR
jgi:DNA-binding MarR family transcriptional regulator